VVRVRAKNCDDLIKVNVMRRHRVADHTGEVSSVEAPGGQVPNRG
jgi:hypothetical protein